MEQLPNLRVLRLARNQMKELDKDIVFPALEELYLMVFSFYVVYVF